MADDLKQRLRDADRGYEPGTMFTEAADRIEALEADMARLQAEVVRLDGVVSTHKVALAAEVAHADRLHERLNHLAHHPAHKDTAMGRRAMEALADHKARRGG